jgi:hypothetical protein
LQKHYGPLKHKENKAASCSATLQWQPPLSQQLASLSYLHTIQSAQRMWLVCVTSKCDFRLPPRSSREMHSPWSLPLLAAGNKLPLITA